MLGMNGGMSFMFVLFVGWLVGGSEGKRMQGVFKMCVRATYRISFFEAYAIPQRFSYQAQHRDKCQLFQNDRRSDHC